MSVDSQIPQNRILAALPPEEYQRLLPDLELVSLPVRQILYEPREKIEHVYFPHQAVASMLSIMLDGGTIEVGLVGGEGMVGVPAVLGGNITTHQCMVQLPGEAMRMKADAIRSHFDQANSHLRVFLLRYVQVLLAQVSQSAACNRFHTVEERFARWMLLVQDAVKADEFALTQEFLADMLGTRRSSVTVAAGTLQQAGTLRYTRGKITILNRQALEATVCECYEVIRREFSQIR